MLTKAGVLQEFVRVSRINPYQSPDLRKWSERSRSEARAAAEMIAYVRQNHKIGLNDIDEILCYGVFGGGPNGEIVRHWFNPDRYAVLVQRENDHGQEPGMVCDVLGRLIFMRARMSAEKRTGNINRFQAEAARISRYVSRETQQKWIWRNEIAKPGQI